MFILTFLITILIATLGFSLVISFMRMENTVSGQEFSIINLTKSDENEINIVFLNEEYLVDFKGISQISENVSDFALFVPSEIKLFLQTIEGSINAVSSCVYEYLG